MRKPVFVGIYQRIIIPGFLRWCRISSIHCTRDIPQKSDKALLVEGSTLAAQEEDIFHNGTWRGRGARFYYLFRYPKLELNPEMGHVLILGFIPLEEGEVGLGWVCLAWFGLGFVGLECACEGVLTLKLSSPLGALIHALAHTFLADHP